MTESPDASFAEVFEQLRLAHGIKVKALAEQLGVYPADVYRWRRSGGISIGNVRKLADLFGVDQAWLERLAGYPEGSAADADHEPDNDLDAHLATVGALLRGIPRPFWGPVIAATTALAKALPPVIPVSDSRLKVVSDHEAGLNGEPSGEVPPLTTRKTGSLDIVRAAVMGITRVTVPVSA